MPLNKKGWGRSAALSGHSVLHVVPSGRRCSRGAILIRTELRQGGLWCTQTIQLTQSRQCPPISCWARRPAHHSLELDSGSKCLATFALFHHPLSRETTSPHFSPETLTCFLTIIFLLYIPSLLIVLFSGTIKNPMSIIKLPARSTSELPALLHVWQFGFLKVCVRRK